VALPQPRPPRLRRARAGGLHLQLCRRGVGDGVECILDPDALTFGFARRFVEYKRPTLLPRDRQRLTRLLCDAARPMQIVVAGKAHPADEQGKQTIEQWIAFANRPQTRARVVCREDSDLELAAELVRGVDLWINTRAARGRRAAPPTRRCCARAASTWRGSTAGGPRHSPPRSAGRSATATTTPAPTPTTTPSCTRSSSAASRLSSTIAAPTGCSAPGIARMRAGLERLVPRFSTVRMAREYDEQLYPPAAAAYLARAADSAQLASELARWGAQPEAHSRQIDFGAIESGARDGVLQIGLRARVGENAPAAVRVELYADARRRAGGARAGGAGRRQRRRGGAGGDIGDDAAGERLHAAGSAPSSRGDAAGAAPAHRAGRGNASGGRAWNVGCIVREHGETWIVASEKCRLPSSPRCAARTSD
jgi:starch phosphorylase